MLATREIGHTSAWPALSLAEWQDTHATLHRWLQMAGKTCLALAPFQNHWWHAALQVTTHGLRTPTLFHSKRTFQIEFDFISHVLTARTSDGLTRSIELAPRSVADFYADYGELLRSFGVDVQIRPIPCELTDSLPFDEDRTHGSYDGHAVRRCWQILLDTDYALKQFRSKFIGKCSPSHFWWGGFDISCTRFSGRVAPPHPGGFPNLPDWVTREAYSHECISAGWWPGQVGSPVPDAAFYAYAYPVPPGCANADVKTPGAYYHTEMGEWILPYEAVRNAPDGDALLAEFLQETYSIAADLGHWDRSALETTVD